MKKALVGLCALVVGAVVFAGDASARGGGGGGGHSGGFGGGGFHGGFGGGGFRSSFGGFRGGLGLVAHSGYGRGYAYPSYNYGYPYYGAYSYGTGYRVVRHHYR